MQDVNQLFDSNFSRVTTRIVSQWPRAWLQDCTILRAFEQWKQDTIVRVLQISDDEFVSPICHTRHPALGFLLSDPATIANHAFWSAQIVVALEAWKSSRPSLWSRQISEDGVRTYRPLLYGPLNHIRKLNGRLVTPSGDLDPQLHPHNFGELCLSLRDQWNPEWPDSYRISGALSFLAVGRRGARRVRHLTKDTTRQSSQHAERLHQVAAPEIERTDPHRHGSRARLNVPSVRLDAHPIPECDANDKFEHQARDGDSLAVLRSRHRALRLDRRCLRSHISQPASDSVRLLVKILKYPEQGSGNAQSRLLAGLALFSGRPFVEVAQFPVLSPRSLRTGLLQTDRWLFRVVLPHSRPESTVLHIDHELPALMQELLGNLSIAPGATIATPGEAEEARDALNAIIEQGSGDIRLIHRAIVGEIRALAAAGDGGVEAILGLNVGHDTQSHYAVIELGRAKQIYRDACARLLECGTEEAFQSKSLSDDDNIHLPRNSPLLITRTPVPTSMQLRELFEAEFTALRSLLRPMSSRSEQADTDAFNSAVSFIVLLQSLLTANRPTHGLYLQKHLVDERTGLVAHGDKTDAEGYERRLLYFPAELLQIMQRFEVSADSWCHSHELAPFSKVACLVRQDGRSVDLTSRAIESHWGNRFRFPANTPRRIHFAWLCQRGTPNLFRNMAMGHWTGGNEPWGQCSSIYVQEYLDWRRSTVTAILPELGLQDLPSIVQMCRLEGAQADCDWQASRIGMAQIAPIEEPSL